MKTITFSCDICGKEFPPQEYSFLTGQVVKINQELKPNTVAFEGHYDAECTHKLLEYIAGLKNAQHPSSS